MDFRHRDQPRLLNVRGKRTHTRAKGSIIEEDETRIHATRRVPMRRTARKRTIFKKGDKAVITNGYQGVVRGTKGTVIHITKTQITLLDKSGKTDRRKFTNLSKTK